MWRGEGPRRAALIPKIKILRAGDLRVVAEASGVSGEKVEAARTFEKGVAVLRAEAEAEAGRNAAPGQHARPPFFYRLNCDARRMCGVAVSNAVFLRPYQAEAISAFFPVGERLGSFESGLLKAPCGSGKTAMGCAIASCVQSRTVVVTNSVLTALHWMQRLNAVFPAERVLLVGDCDYASGTQLARALASPPYAVVMTYQALAHQRGEEGAAHPRSDGGAEGKAPPSRARDTNESRLGALATALLYGVAIFDEAQCLPAATFAAASRSLSYLSCVGLSATLRREDEGCGLALLKRAIGPVRGTVRYAALTLPNVPYLASVTRYRVVVPHPDSLRRFCEGGCPLALHAALTLSPQKMALLAAILLFHVAVRRDKVILFVESLACLDPVSDLVRGLRTQRQADVPLFGPLFVETPVHRRRSAIEAFLASNGGCLLTSSVCDVGIDLVEANVAVQMLHKNGSGNQAAQQLGRIMRPKASAPNTATHYSLVAEGTSEVEFEARRDGFLSNEEGIPSEQVPFSSVFSRLLPKDCCCTMLSPKETERRGEDIAEAIRVFVEAARGHGGVQKKRRKRERALGA